jgi:hypothetical protein
VSRPRRRVDWKAYDQFRAQLDGASAPLVHSIDMALRNCAQYKRTRHRDEPPAAVNGADDANIDVPVSSNLPAIPASQPIAAHRGEPPTWVSRGVQVAADMLEVIDLFLRTGAAHLGEGVRHDG